MKYRITHSTRYDYQDKVAVCQNQAYLALRDTPLQNCRRTRLLIRPRPVILEEREDYFGNHAHYFAIQNPHKELHVIAVSIVEVKERPSPVDLAASPPWEQVRDELAQDFSQNGLEARAYVLESPFVKCFPQLLEFTRRAFTPARPLLEATHALMDLVFNEFTYDPHFTTIVTPLQTVLEHKRGVCQDFAHLMIACLRCLGLPARYVSGYLETLPPPGQEKLQGADASHAWLAVYSPGQGWVDFDPTNNVIPGVQHITTAWGRDYGDVTPLRGIIYGGGTHTLNVAVDVERLSTVSAP